MRSRQLLVVVANGIVLLATNVAFNAWVDHRFGYLDLDMIGISGIAWPMLVVVATVCAWLGFHVGALRWVTGVVVLVLALIVADHAIGAPRDGEVFPAGIVTGALMGLQCVALVVSIVLSRGQGERIVHAGVGLMVGLVLALIVAGAVAVGRVAGPEPKRAAVDAWLQALAGGAPDRGWSLLGGLTRDGTELDRYTADAAIVRWDTFEWRIGRVDDHDGFWSVELEVEGGLDAVPRFFFEHGLAYPVCVDHRGTGIGVWVETPLLGSATIDGGPMTDRMERGECAGPIAAEESVPPDPVTWGAAPTWTGNALEVWNRTTLDLFLLDEAGVRIDLPACGRASTSRLDLRQTVEVRAEDGHRRGTQASRLHDICRLDGAYDGSRGMEWWR